MFTDYLNSFKNVLAATRYSTFDNTDVDFQNGLDKVIELLKKKRESGATVYLIGNGGSSGIVSHAAIDFLNACGFKAHALTDNSLLTCMANDYGYENVFEQPLKTLLKEEDVLISISSSGKSRNIVKASEFAKSKEATVITFSGFASDNPLRKSGDHNFWVESKDYGQVEIGHALLVHYLTDHLNNK